MDKRDIMVNSIYKNVGELAEMCLDYNIADAYELMDVIALCSALIGYLEKQNKSPNLKGLHDNVLKQIMGEDE